MRLLNVCTEEFEIFPSPADRPPYAIASHRWIGNEVTHQQWLDRHSFDPPLPGFAKISRLCNFMQRWALPRMHGSKQLQWIWIDTCCINKDSTTELSEAINSMFRWYADAAVCLAFLHDVRAGLQYDDPVQQDLALADFQRSVWFQRGWTLQELIAPRLVVFLDQEMFPFGHKLRNSASDRDRPEDLSACTFGRNLNETIANVANIPLDVVSGATLLPSLDVQTKRRWIAGRTTTRPEDAAYCLLGICGVHLPLIYGEGEEEAMDRLEDAIERKLARVRRQQDSNTFPERSKWSSPSSQATNVSPQQPASNWLNRIGARQSTTASVRGYDPQEERRSNGKTPRVVGDVRENTTIGPIEASAALAAEKQALQEKEEKELRERLIAEYEENGREEKENEKKREQAVRAAFEEMFRQKKEEERLLSEKLEAEYERQKRQREEDERKAIAKYEEWLRQEKEDKERQGRAALAAYEEYQQWKTLHKLDTSL